MACRHETADRASVGWSRAADRPFAEGHDETDDLAWTPALPETEELSGKGVVDRRPDMPSVPRLLAYCQKLLMAA